MARRLLEILTKKLLSYPDVQVLDIFLIGDTEKQTQEH